MLTNSTDFTCPGIAAPNQCASACRVQVTSANTEPAGYSFPELPRAYCTAASLPYRVLMVEACRSTEDVITFHCNGFQGRLPAIAALSLIDDVLWPEAPQFHIPNATMMPSKHPVPILALIAAP